MLLSNLTASPSACAALLKLTIPLTGTYAPQARCVTCPEPSPLPDGSPIDTPVVPLLVDTFVQGASEERKASHHFLASVFANITTVGGSYLSDLIYSSNDDFSLPLVECHS